MLVCERGHISLVLTVLDSGAEINFQQKVVKLIIRLTLANYVQLLYRQQDRVLSS